MKIYICRGHGDFAPCAETGLRAECDNATVIKLEIWYPTARDRGRLAAARFLALALSKGSTPDRVLSGREQMQWHDWRTLAG